MGNYLKRIDFKNNQAPWLNDINLNKLQDNVEDAITELHAQGVATGDTLPIGSILPFAGSTIPENWLECKGQAVSRTDYAELFSAIGTIWGTGDGSTTFNLPDLQGRVTVGKDEDDTDFDEVGKTGGEKEHTLTVAEMPAHNHNFNKTNVATMAGSGANEMSQISGGRTYELLGIQNTGGSQAHNNLQPYAVSAYIIKAKQSSGLVADVVDNLTSDSTTDALSAKQGKILNEKIENMSINIISGQEIKTGRYINGSPEYLKRIDFGVLPNTDSKKVASGLTNITITRPLQGLAKNETGLVLNIPHSSPSLLTFNVSVAYYHTDNTIEVVTGNDRSSYTSAFVDIYYTKK